MEPNSLPFMWGARPPRSAPPQHVPKAADPPRVSHEVVDPVGASRPPKEPSMADVVAELRETRAMMDRHFLAQMALHRSRAINLNVAKTIKVDNSVAETTIDCIKELGGIPALFVSCLSLGTGTVSVRTPDMVGAVSQATTGEVFENEEITRFSVIVSGGSGSSLWRLNGWAPPFLAAAERVHDIVR
jgi:hypothetical protein